MKAGRIIGRLAILMAALSLTPHAHANVYATNIKLNGSLFGTTNNAGSPITITYILNEPATLGTTINILSSNNVVDTISLVAGSAGTLRGLNSVVWGGTNSSGQIVPVGTYSVSITPASSGFTNWTQTSIDSNSGNYAYFPWGIDVDRNTNSAYYGRVVVSSAGTAAGNPTNKLDGLYKMNADGSPADEGWYGNAGYFADDGGDTPAAGQMPNSGGFNPQTVRIGEDDRIYWVDNSSKGAVIATDILATTNQIVINQTGYADCPQASDLAVFGWGIRQFDVCGIGTSNAAVYLVDTGDYPSWGVWMWHITNGVADTNDTVGTQAVATGGDLVVTGAGIMVDYNLDIFVSQSRGNAGDPLQRTFLFTNWNGGMLPPGGSSYDYAEGTGIPPTAWEVGGTDDFMTAIWDTAIDSRANPTKVAVAMANGAAETGGYNGKNGGIRILSAVDGSIISSNLDISSWYNGVAFDNVGNVYGCSRSANVWRVWSPPGANQATTLAVAKVTLTTAATPIHITGIKITGSSVILNFTGAATASASSFTLYGSSSVKGPYTPVSSAVTQISPGVFQITASTSGAAQFYRLYGPTN